MAHTRFLPEAVLLVAAGGRACRLPPPSESQWLNNYGAGISLEEVMAALETGKERYAGQGDEDWQSRSLAELVNHIVQEHHVYTKSELERLDQLSAKVASVHGRNHPELQKVRDLFLAP